MGTCSGNRERKREMRLFDWTNGKNTPGAGAYRFWLDGTEIPEDAPVFRVEASDRPNVEVDGILCLYERDENGNILGPIRWKVEKGRVRWDYI